MSLSRRQLLLGAAVGATGAVVHEDVDAAPLQPSATEAMAKPPFEVIALSRMAYGARSGDYARVRTMGLTAYVDEQLNPNFAADTDCNTRIANAKLRIVYAAGTGFPAVDEMRGLVTLNKTQPELWELRVHPSNTERIRPVDEVVAANWIRAIYSKWQLFEIMTDFWHNHFNVWAYSDTRISALWPHYDKTVIRANCFGNFRKFLEAVATSPAMLYYLDNSTSRDGPANENFARELFELHTFGSQNYLNNIYDNWQEVPRDNQGRPIGYIDQDVYEAARAFTGWTVADGVGGIPNTGVFHYVDTWNDNAQKIVLANFLNANAGPQVHGKAVLDLVAKHPATIRNICTKLCRRLVSDNPPKSLVDKAVAVWTTNYDAPDQIKKTIRAILLAPEFLATWGGKIRRPNEVVAAYLRSTGAEVKPTAELFSWITICGYRMFNWATPTGHPDESGYWSSSNALLNTWNLLFHLQQAYFPPATFDLQGQMPSNVTTVRQIVDYWVMRMLGYQPSALVKTKLLNLMGQAGNLDAVPVGSANDVKLRLSSLVHMIGMLPEFYTR
ncbi:DUF1800 domain-containing protein [Herpetosiphon sp. NSE202]|uniref:DUF1800 domain-containing protein n=1 Tax=Herpetosiphon sp. NSE202 TaxID=3351349 RepID=UPI00363C46CA